MNEWPDELWWAEVEAYANAVENQDSQFTTASSNLTEALGLLIIASCCVAAALLAATVGWSITRRLLRKRAITSGPGTILRVSPS